MGVAVMGAKVIPMARVGFHMGVVVVDVVGVWDVEVGGQGSLNHVIGVWCASGVLVVVMGASQTLVI